MAHGCSWWHTAPHARVHDRGSRVGRHHTGCAGTRPYMRGHHHARTCGRSAAEGHAGHPLLKQELLLLDPLLLHHQVLLLLLWRHLLED